MKQNFLLILAVIFIIICVICTMLINIRAEQSSIKKENNEFEKYLNQEILGTELASLISKVVDKNERNLVSKDSNRLLYRK